ncbi:MAG: F-type H+-transporting ATPase subunit epsilon [Hyphomicrobiaceae bacterium]|jgi:F-type H+-transporting ATPase subunit epsilon
MQLRVVTPTALLVDEEVSEITAPGVVGEFGVLPGHVTFLGGLDVGVLRYRSADGSEKCLVIDGGYAEVRDDLVMILADDALAPGDLDAAAERAELAKLEADAAAGGDGPEAVDSMLRAVKRAQARVAVTG